MWRAGVILVVVAALPVLCAWAPATVSTACDDLLDQLNDLSFLGAANLETAVSIAECAALHCREFGAPDASDAPATQPDEPDAGPGARVPGGRHGDRQAHARNDGRWASCPRTIGTLYCFPPDGGAVSATGKASVAGASLITAMVTLGHHEQTEGVTNITLASA